MIHYSLNVCLNLDTYFLDQHYLKQNFKHKDLSAILQWYADFYTEKFFNEIILVCEISIVSLSIYCQVHIHRSKFILESGALS